MEEPSQSRGPVDAGNDDVKSELGRIWYLLDGHMKRPRGEATKPDKIFICEADVRRIWSRPSQVKKVFSGWPLSDQHEYYILQNMLLLLSCLIYVSPTAEALDCFVADFWKQHLKDSDLPLKPSQVGSPLEPAVNKFFEMQYAFKPYVIKLTSDSDRLKVEDNNLRMPFEVVEKRIGSGGYGDVHKVAISAEYLHESQLVNSEVRVVACKKVRKPENFKDELKNVRILRESITRHTRIMTHLGAIEHGQHHYILFPYAEFGDLRQFLDQETQGYDKYKHAEELPGAAAPGSDIAASLILQLHQICHALNWLHNDVRLADGGDKVVCVHMDLNPNNILIKRSDTGAASYDKATDVGRWLISDFGISVVKNDPTYRYDVDYLSIGQFIDRQRPLKQTTLMEAPIRGGGTHQAPEVERYHNLSNGSSSSNAAASADQVPGGVGRRSDVWSFACICAEVLAFQVGRQAEVQNFRARRRENKDSNFYEPFSGPSLRPGPITEFRVRQSVTKWLDEQARRPSDQHWIECFVGYIKKTLIVDPAERPNTKELEKYMYHVRRHVSHSKQAELYKCELLQQAHEPEKSMTSKIGTVTSSELKSYPTVDERTSYHTPPDIPPCNEPTNPTSFPATANIHGHFAQRPSISITTPDATPIDHQSSLHSRKDSHKTSSPVEKPRPPMNSAQVSNTSKPLLSPTISDNESSRTPKSIPAYAVPQILNGIFIKPDIDRRVGKTSLETVPGFGKNKKTKLFAVNTACNGDYQLKVGYVLADAVHFFQTDCQYMRHQPALTTIVPRALQIRELILSGDYVSVLGTRQGQNTVYICERTSPQFKELSSIPTGSVRVCSKVIVSQLGLVAAVCDNVIYVVCVADSKIVGRLTTANGASFSDAAFNECGNRLLAWAFGRDKDVLHVWRCDGKMPIEDAKEAMTSYAAIKDKAASTRVLPYSSYQGSIIKASGQRYSAAQIRGSTLGLQEAVKLDWILIENAKVAIIYQDHSLLTLDQPLRPWEGCRLVERRIEYPGNYDLEESGFMRRSSMQTTHILSSRGELIHRFDSKAKDNSQIQIVRADNEIHIILYNDDGKAEWVQLVPS